MVVHGWFYWTLLASIKWNHWLNRVQPKSNLRFFLDVTNSFRMLLNLVFSCWMTTSFQVQRDCNWKRTQKQKGRQDGNSRKTKGQHQTNMTSPHTTSMHQSSHIAVLSLFPSCLFFCTLAHASQNDWHKHIYLITRSATVLFWCTLSGL